MSSTSPLPGSADVIISQYNKWVKKKMVISEELLSVFWFIYTLILTVSVYSSCLMSVCSSASNSHLLLLHHLSSLLSSSSLFPTLTFISTCTQTHFPLHNIHFYVNADSALISRLFVWCHFSKSPMRCTTPACIQCWSCIYIYIFYKHSISSRKWWCLEVWLYVVYPRGACRWAQQLEVDSIRLGD